MYEFVKFGGMSSYKLSNFFCVNCIPNFIYICEAFSEAVDHWHKIKAVKIPTQMKEVISMPLPQLRNFWEVIAARGGRIILLGDVITGRFLMLPWMVPHLYTYW